MYCTGFPAHNYPDGINLPGGTTELWPIAQPTYFFNFDLPFSSLAPSKITHLNPTYTSSSIVHEYSVEPLEI